MKTYRPITKSRRQMTGIDYKDVLTRSEPEKSLTAGFLRRVGRSKSDGSITVRHKGSGHKRLYRFVDFKQDKFGVPGKIMSIEYDPNRSAFISLILYLDGEKRYILTPRDVKVGDKILTAEKTPLKNGNRMQLKNIPVGYFVHNIELFSGRGGQIVRSAGSGARVMAIEGGFAQLELPSKEIRRVPENSYASLGFVSNPENNVITIGKAGRSRHLGIRPTVRGSAMNPVDHPHGGGEGRAPIGLKYPKTPWGKHALGVKTRKRGKQSDRFILQRRKK